MLKSTQSFEETIKPTQDLNISIDIFTGMINKNNSRSPTLDTILMVEQAIKDHSGEFNRTTLWKSLPKKVMWQTYLIILDYLHNINKIATDKEGKIGYIWNEELTRKLKNRKEIEI